MRTAELDASTEVQESAAISRSGPKQGFISDVTKSGGAGCGQLPSGAEESRQEQTYPILQEAPSYPRSGSGRMSLAGLFPSTYWHFGGEADQYLRYCCMTSLGQCCWCQSSPRESKFRTKFFLTNWISRVLGSYLHSWLPFPAFYHT